MARIFWLPESLSPNPHLRKGIVWFFCEYALHYSKLQMKVNENHFISLGISTQPFIKNTPRSQSQDSV